ncbi:hypothetical protein B0H63DRAFT_520469 [Podospora didyma]|uniref:Secreted protein n=1 Tax=Podospora didyma TaxID=330526 RepID=A0AAE0P1F4_9PEZI|nr:hypothetical protein B0H63DRAFT_520469 [Podospora didyma]
MKFLSLATASPPLLLAAAANAQVLPDNVTNHTEIFMPNSPPYWWGKVAWSGQILPDGPNVTVMGASLYDIEQKIARTYPGFTWETAPGGGYQEPAAAENTYNTTDSLNAIANYDIDLMGINCREGQRSRSKYIHNGVNYLRKVPGWCENGPGPDNCGQISCSYKTAIVWCNDNTVSYGRPCRDFGNFTNEIVKQCGNGTQFGGQLYHSDNFRVRIQWSEC